MKIGTLCLLFFLPVAALTPRCLAVTSCAAAAANELTDAEQAFLRGHFDAAADLYQARLKGNPGDPLATAGLARVLLRQQKIGEAEALVTGALARNSESALLFNALGEVQYREGKPWLAEGNADAALRLDPCAGRPHLLNSRLLRLSSNYASAAAELKQAHKLDPTDPEIRRRWMDSLSLKHHISELETYLASDTGDDPQELSHLRLALEDLKKRATEPHKPCRMAAGASSTEMYLLPTRGDGVHLTSFGLATKLNGEEARLQVDTGASGLTVGRAMAARAHLAPYTGAWGGGVGDEGEKSSYRAVADTIQIGAFEFHDCEVTVIDLPDRLDGDGLIGTNVFAGFLVTLDYPTRQMRLAPLPKRPDDPDSQKPTLETSKSPPAADEPEQKTSASEPAQDAAKTKAAKTPRVRHDRYIAPEMKDWTRIYRVNQLLLVPTELNDGVTRLFALDTGAYATAIVPEAARAVTTVHLDSKRSIHGMSGKVGEVYKANEVEFRFGGIQQKERNAVCFAIPAVSKDAGIEVSGFIGATTLSKMTVSIDYRDGLVKFDYDPKHTYEYPEFK